MSLIERLEEANKHLIGAKEHHDAIAEAVTFLKRHRVAIRIASAILETARPLVLNTMQVQEAEQAIDGKETIHRV